MNHHAGSTKMLPWNTRCFCSLWQVHRSTRECRIIRPQWFRKAKTILPPPLTTAKVPWSVWRWWPRWAAWWENYLTRLNGWSTGCENWRKHIKRVMTAPIPATLVTPDPAALSVSDTTKSWHASSLPVSPPSCSEPLMSATYPFISSSLARTYSFIIALFSLSFPISTIRNNWIYINNIATPGCTALKSWRVVKGMFSRRSVSVN